MLIGIGHKKRAGKDTVANMLIMSLASNLLELDASNLKTDIPDGIISFVEENKYNFENLGYYKKSFAENLKRIVMILTGLNQYELEDAKNNNHIFPFKYEDKEITYREALQYIGTDIFRSKMPNIWVESLLSQYDTLDTSKTWIIPDVRIKNEAQAIKNRGGILLNVHNPNLQSQDPHPSETDLDDYEYDYTIENNGSLEDLLLEVINVVNKIKPKNISNEYNR